MGAYCLRALMPSHTALVGEILQVLWSDYYGAVIFGDRQEIACVPHKGCRLEIVATADATHPLVKLLLPGHVIRYKRSFFFWDRFELPSGVRVGLDELVGFKLQLAPSPAPAPSVEELILERARHAEEGAGGSDLLVPSPNHGGGPRPVVPSRMRPVSGGIPGRSTPASVVRSEDIVSPRRVATQGRHE